MSNNFEESDDINIYKERYELSVYRIKQIHSASEQKIQDNCSFCPGAYFFSVSSFLLSLNQLYLSSTGNTTFKDCGEAAQLNHSLYEDILPDHYGSSYANPEKSVEAFGKHIGLMLCELYAELRSIIPYAAESDITRLTMAYELFIEVYCIVDSFTTSNPITAFQAISKDSPLYLELHDAIYYYVYDYSDITIANRTFSQIDNESSFVTHIITECDLGDLSYLYKYGDYISDNELKAALYINSLPYEDIQAMAYTFTEGFRKGFELYEIDLKKKKTVNIRYNIGFERIVLEEIRQFKELGLTPIIYRAHTDLVNKNRGTAIGVISTSANRQYDYDHRQDDECIMDKAYLDRRISIITDTYEKYKEKAMQLAGPAVMEVFGYAAFSPAENKYASKYTEHQNKLLTSYRSKLSAVVNTYIPADTTSFTIISYPVPDIINNLGPSYCPDTSSPENGSDIYNEIFKEVITINTLDTSKYYDVQATLISALDKADYVHITGREGNLTDMFISIRTPQDPEHETAFENCLADVNIPLGEVFTSPVLKGTHGRLFVSDIYLNELQYKNLSIEFKDGLVNGYSCSGFDTAANAKSYIKQNILFGHDTLPIGEFAIGTNTAAYNMATKYDILKIMPILITEKTGPHFALGDTCFSHEEELVTYNPDGRKMIAKENDFSILRNTTPEKAYFNCHTDITIPYNELGDITVHTSDNQEIPIIKKGRFVLEGTLCLNEYLD